jgi:hypothetical protein
MKKIMLIAIIAAMFLAGCSGSASDNKQNSINVRIGFSGLDFGFLPSTPPNIVFEHGVFPVMIQVRNTGAYNIEGEEAIISLGVERDYTQGITLRSGGQVTPINSQNTQGTSASFMLEGRSRINPLGDEAIISYNVQAGKIDPQSEKHQSTILATLCYPYQTIVDASVCIDTDVNNLLPSKKVCQRQDIIFGNGQGGPVTVSKIETQMLPTGLDLESNQKIRPQFLIYIENKGTGIVIDKNSYSDFCTSSQTTHEKYNVVFIDAKLSGIGLDCKLETGSESFQGGYLKLKDKKDIIRCLTGQGQDIDLSKDTFTAPLQIVLDYGYTQSVSKSYEIRKPVR